MTVSSEARGRCPRGAPARCKLGWWAAQGALAYATDYMTTNFSTNPRAITAAPPATRGGRARGVLIALGALALLAVAAGAWVRAHPRTAASPTAGGAARPDRKPRVAAITVQAKPFPILLEGLGTV